MNKPVIGLLLDWQENGSFSKRPHYAVRQDYFDAVSACGGLPMGLPYDRENMKDHIDRIDGLLCPGGNYASPPEWYLDGMETTYDPSPRAEYEIELIRKVLDAGKPVLAICGGMQVMSAAFGAKMVPDLHSYFDTDIDHKNGTSSDGFAYRVDIEPGSRLAKITGETSMRVNSAHKEAVVETGDQITTVAVAEDGVIQGIEVPEYDFAVGVQWHPEMFVKDDKGEPGHRKLFEALIAKARSH